MKKKDIHEESVRKIQSKMRSFFSAETKVKVYHGTTNSTRQQRFKKGNMVDVSALNNVIEVNTEERYVLAEPNVSMDDLVRETLRHGLLPKVVMEFPGITVGGGIQGGAGESSSFKYGLFHSTCLEYEIVLGDGTVVVCSPNVNQDLFYGTACSYGSLGVITLAKIALVDSKPFIKLTYTRTGDTSSFFKLLYNEIDRKVDYVDGIIFLNDHSVVMSGVFSELTSLPISTFTKRTDPWFYLHAKEMSQEPKVDKPIKKVGKPKK
jgi:FAD/FMN-containing dehydrogenase